MSKHTILKGPYALKTLGMCVVPTKYSHAHSVTSAMSGIKVRGGEKKLPVLHSGHRTCFHGRLANECWAPRSPTLSLTSDTN